MLTRLPARAVAASLAVVVCLGAVGCGRNAAPGTVSPPAASGMDLSPDTTGAGDVPGALWAAATLPVLDLRLKGVTSLAARIEYTSTSGVTDERTRVTGTVFVPAGGPPPGGWPITVYAHRSTGVQPDCAPSQSPTLLGASTDVTGLIRAGYLVVVPDYQGLGGEGSYHPFLEPRTVGYNVIDAVRAARRLVPAASDRWVVDGSSQGGQAAWSANELASEYGAGLSLLGSVSVAPAADFTGLADEAAAGTLTTEQQQLLIGILTGLAAENPDFPLNDYRRGAVEREWDALTSCSSQTAIARETALADMTPEDTQPASPEATDRLRDDLRRLSLPQRAASAPMSVIYGGMDTLLPPAWTELALQAACGMGDVIDIQIQPDKGHGDIDESGVPGWLKDRFDEVPAPSSCESFLGASIPEGAPAGEVAPTGEQDSGPGE